MILYLTKENRSRRERLVVAFSVAAVLGLVTGTLAAAKAPDSAAPASDQRPSAASGLDHMALAATEPSSNESTASGARGCPYIDRYLAPLELPVTEHPTSMVGPPPGDGPEEIEQREVGPTACDVVHEETIENVHGVPYRRETLGVDGTLFGFVTENPPRDEQFSDQFLTVGSANQWGPFFPGAYHYAHEGNSTPEVEIVFPERREDWNGGLWVIAHGVSYYSSRANFPSREAGEFNRFMNQSGFAAALIDEGYEIAHTRRGGTGRSSTQPSEFAVLDDGRTVGGPGEIGMAVNNGTSILRDFTVIAQNYLNEHLGQQPEATFFRGHSAGEAVGRTFNTVPGWNIDHEGGKLYDGIYISDTSSGRGPLTWFLEAEVTNGGVVELVESDIDSLTFNEEHRSLMAKSVETMHGGYIGGSWVHTDWHTKRAGETAARIPPSYMELKRDLARILVEKNLHEDLWRFYEIADVGHNDATGERNSWPENAEEMIDIGGISVALKEALVEWTVHDEEPPAPRVDARDVWDFDASVGSDIELPESACPRGAFRPYIERPN